MKLSFKNILSILLIFTLLILFAGCGTTPPLTYTVTYNGNGSTGGAVPIDANLYEEGASVTVLGNTGILVRTGYTFDDWNTAADGTGTSYEALDTFNMGTANVTLYAQWTASPGWTGGGGVPVIPVLATSPLASFTPLTLTQTGDVAHDDVQYVDAAAVIAALPTTVAVTLVNASVVNVPVTWTDTDTYNDGVAADYTFTATWGAMPAGANNDNNLAVPTVEVTVAAGTLAIGDSYGGGKVAYIDVTGQHGLIAAIADQSTGKFWHASNNGTTGATATALGTGNANTNTIVAFYGTENNAAKLCADYTNIETGTGVYSDWYLPSRDELYQLYLNRVAIGGFSTDSNGRYWSSSEHNSSQAVRVNFQSNGAFEDRDKDSTYRVRAVRTF